MDELKPAATQVNAVSVETPHGLRTFELYAGDMFSQTVDLMVISTHHQAREPASGPLVDSLSDRFAFHVDTSSATIRFGGGISACVQTGHDQTPFQELLTMRIAAPRLQKNPAAFYDRAIQSTFASVAMLEFLGREFEIISLPVLVRQGIVDYASAVRSLLRHALTWLRRSRHTHSVRYSSGKSGDRNGDSRSGPISSRTEVSLPSRDPLQRCHQCIRFRIRRMAIKSIRGELDEQ